jgi:hypothetical protein
MVEQRDETDRIPIFSENSLSPGSTLDLFLISIVFNKYQHVIELNDRQVR